MLERQIHTHLFLRLLKSRDQAGVLDLATRGQALQRPIDTLRDPYVLDFLGLPEVPQLRESDLESAIIAGLQHFLLELGKGFAFVARQKRLEYDDECFYIDLVFYNVVLKCYLLVDLKMGKLTHQDVGQMVDSYVRLFDDRYTTEGDNPTIGLILCAQKNEAVPGTPSCTRASSCSRRGTSPCSRPSRSSSGSWRGSGSCSRQVHAARARNARVREQPRPAAGVGHRLRGRGRGGGLPGQRVAGAGRTRRLVPESAPVGRVRRAWGHHLRDPAPPPPSVPPLPHAPGRALEGVRREDGRPAARNRGRAPRHPAREPGRVPERLDVFNGFLLAAHLDAAFDAGFVTVGDDGVVVVSDALDAEARALLGLDRPVRIRGLADGHRRYLAWYRKVSDPGPLAP